jgi:hypothetical protein
MGCGMTVEQIARVCHEANRAYCLTIGDASQQPWAAAEDWQRESACRGVVFKLGNPDATPEAQHEAWRLDKVADGWVYGTVKDPAKKTHPCLVPYAELPVAQRRKDALFAAIVTALGQD